MAAKASRSRGRGSGRGSVRIKINVAAIDAANNAELRANAQNILETTRATRPKNTVLAYGPKQKEFQVS